MNKVSFTADQKSQLVNQLQQYFERELNQEIGEFDAEFLLDFFGEKVGGHYYNQGLRDAQTVLMSRVHDIAEAIEETEQVTDFYRE